MGLQDIVRNVILEKMIHAVTPVRGQWKVLVLDEHSTRIISAAVRMHDIMEEGVSLVENLKIDRQPLPDMEAVYFITPSEESVNQLCKDFLKPSRPQYGDVHLFFTSRIPEQLLGRIKAQTQLLQRIKTFKELNLEFLAVESQAFVFDRPQSFRALYAPAGSSAVEQQKIAGELLTLFTTMGEYPAIRAARGQVAAKNIASMLQQHLDEFKRLVPTFPNTMENQPTVLIFDRSQDPVAPVIHEYSYQAMVYDMLNIQKDRYKYKVTAGTGETTDKEVLLNENDVLWPTLRHMHIAEVLEYVPAHFKKFVAENKTADLAKKGGASDMAALGEAMRNMPQYRERIGKFSLHLDLSKEAMAVYDRRNLEGCSRHEQNMAVGEDAQGQPLKGLATALMEVLNDPKVGPEEKIRLLMIYAATQDVRETDLARLIEMAKLSPTEAAAVTNLRHLGGGKLPKKDKKKDKKKSKAGEVFYENWRFRPVLNDVLTDLLDGTLSPGDYPYEREPVSSSSQVSVSVAGTSARSKPKAGWASARKDGKSGKEEESTMSGPRVYVFVLGGVTHSEMRCCYEFAKTHHREVIVGSTHLATPKLFIELLSGLQ